jgi:hypothetical protein
MLHCIRSFHQRSSSTSLATRSLPGLSIIVVSIATWSISMRSLVISLEGEDFMIFAEAKGSRARCHSQALQAELCDQHFTQLDRKHQGLTEQRNRSIELAAHHSDASQIVQHCRGGVIVTASNGAREVLRVQSGSLFHVAQGEQHGSVMPANDAWRSDTQTLHQCDGLSEVRDCRLKVACEPRQEASRNRDQGQYWGGPGVVRQGRRVVQ